jgi:uncharacterized protein (TIGR01244 family)
MPPVAVSRKLWVMSQPSLHEFKRLADRGFGTVINNRPDGEDADQPGSSAEESAARAAGLSYVQIPVTSAGMVAHGRSGARSFALWLMTGDLENKTDDEILALAQELHLDLKAVAARLAARRKQAAGQQAAGENA